MDIHDDLIECILRNIDEVWELVPLRRLSVRWCVCIDRAIQARLCPYLAAMRIRCEMCTSSITLRYARSLCMERDRELHPEPPPRYKCIRCGGPKFEVGADACCRLRRLQWKRCCYRTSVVLLVVLLGLNIVIHTESLHTSLA